MPSLENATAHSPTLVSAIRRGIEAARAGDKRKAHALFRQVVDFDPTNEAAWLWYANTAENPADALHGLRMALRVNPANAVAVDGLPAALTRAGVAAARGGDRLAAVALLGEATTLDPNSETAWVWRAGVTADPAEAIGYLERVLRLNPKNEHAKQGIARLKPKLSQETAACPFCGQRPRDEFDTIADICVRCGALKVLHHPEKFDQPIVGLNRAALEAAVRRLKQSWSTAPAPATAYALGLAFLNLGDGEQAVRALQTAVQGARADPQWKEGVAILLAHRQAKAPGAAARAVKPQPPAPRVMVVDDSPTVRKLVSSILTAAGYQVSEASAAEEAAEEVRRGGPPRLFILDVNMPGTDGFGLCKLLRAERETASVPVVFLTGKTGLLSKLHGRWAGAADYLTKPFQPEKLLAVVARLVPLSTRKS